MKRNLVSVFLLLFCCLAEANAQEWWQTWDNYPKVPRISAQEAKQLILAGEKVVFVYAGYEVDEVVCGSFYIPYTQVPPADDGSKVTFRVPRDYWILCYCP
jgi:hypothetical protein